MKNVLLIILGIGSIVLSTSCAKNRETITTIIFTQNDETGKGLKVFDDDDYLGEISNSTTLPMLCTDSTMVNALVVELPYGRRHLRAEDVNGNLWCSGRIKVTETSLETKSRGTDRGMLSVFVESDNEFIVVGMNTPYDAEAYLENCGN